jgi:hypothetical protein
MFNSKKVEISHSPETSVPSQASGQAKLLAFSPDANYCMRLKIIPFPVALS